MRLLTREQSQIVDRLAQEQFHLSSDLLIAAAAKEIFNVLHSLWPQTSLRITVFAGPGNNGKDATLIYKLLIEAGYKFTQLVQISNTSQDLILASLKHCDFIVDGLLGTGLNRPVEGREALAIRAMNESRKKIVSVDTPSGLDVNTGQILGIAVRASLTVTIGCAKPGFFVDKGPAHTGKVVVRKINFPDELLQKIGTTHFAFGSRGARALLPDRNSRSNKAKNGRLLILAGSYQYPGAAVLASTAGLRAGAGYVYVSSFEDFRTTNPLLPEVIYEKSLNLQQQKDFSIVLGPGLGVGKPTLTLIENLKSLGANKVLLDADALSSLEMSPRAAQLPSSWVLTPHSGELGKLINISPEEIEKNRFHYANLAAKQLGCIVLLKGFHTIVATPSVATVVLSGNAALSKAGSGDTLAGMIGAFMAQGLSPYHASLLGAYVHGKLADSWIADKDIISLIPSDLSARLPALLKKIRQGSKTSTRPTKSSI